MIKIKDKRAFIFYFLMSIIFLDFGNQIRKISYNPAIQNIDNSIFRIIHVNNTGSAFSILKDYTLFLIIFGVVLLLIIFIYTLNNISFNKDKAALFSLTIFTGGALGNLIERVQNGYVIDYIKLNFIDFPVFNAFDIMICTGIFLYIILTLFEESFKKIKKPDENS